ncbi:MAG: protein phosphatase 2C domain-containing protein [Alphaproteobacteria bacterium]|nr:protein phosphatase 2C domain-containing protein [Alphaproteobacteria bacterium]
MRFELVQSLSIPGDPEKANDDAFAVEPMAATVFDGATGLGGNLMPGPSDAAWIAQFGARRLLAHLRESDEPVEALRRALADTKTSFEGLRRRAPKERYEIPYASMILAVAREDSVEALWFGDCAMLVERLDGEVEMVGEAFDKRAAEANRARMLSDAKGLPPVGALSRAEFTPHIRSARNHVNTDRGGWLFSPEPRAADHVASRRVSAAPGTHLLLASDGFLALACDYGAYDAAGLLRAARDNGLAALAQEVRAIENEDFDGRRFPRFKKSDDCTAVLLKVI